MTRGYMPTLILLAAIWGASYLFIKIAVREMEPATMIALRLCVAAAVVSVLLVWQIGPRAAAAAVRATGRHGLVLGVINGALPFWLIAWGEKHVDSGVAAIANSTVPIFTVLLAIHYRPSERVFGMRLGGIVVGLAGVVVLAGFHPKGGLWAVAGTLAVVVASLSYARANLYTQQHLGGVSSLTIATAATVTGFLAILPIGLVQLPSTVPSWEALGSVLAPAIVGTAFASVILYRSLRLYGASRTALVTYLLPVFALVYGAVFLEERVTANALVGLALILAGVALGSGLVRPRRRDAFAAGAEP